MATKDHRIEIADGDEQPISGPVNFIRLHASTGPLKIEVDGHVTELVEGQAIVLDDLVDGFTVENDSGADITATFKLGEHGKVEDTNLAGTVSVRKSTTANDNGADETIADTETDTIVANAARQQLRIQAALVNTAALRIGPNAAAGRGEEVGPGQMVTYNTTAAIKVHNDTGDDQDYRWTSLED